MPVITVVRVKGKITSVFRATRDLFFIRGRLCHPWVKNPSLGRWNSGPRFDTLQHTAAATFPSFRGDRMMPPLATRRQFLTHSAAGTAALWAGGLLETSRGFAANDTLQVGCIGTGGRCQWLMERLNRTPNVRMTA